MLGVGVVEFLFFMFGHGRARIVLEQASKFTDATPEGSFVITLQEADADDPEQTCISPFCPGF